MTLFVNADPVSPGVPCPDHLGPAVELGERALRVVVEVTERAVAGDPARLLGTVAQARRAGWGVALDDVGAAPASRAAFTGALGHGMPVAPVAGVRGADLAADDPLRGEWDLIVIGPRLAAALVANGLGDQGPDDRRGYDVVVTTTASWSPGGRAAAAPPGPRALTHGVAGLWVV